jgi:serine/threonine-protein kinase
MTTRHDVTPQQASGADDESGHQPGDIVARKYLLRRVIGIGGMGTVWAATNIDLGLEVALKLVNDGLDADETRARLGTEARAEAKVQHRGIVRVLDLGVTEQREPFLVMERLEGRSLGDLLCDTGAVAAKDAVRLMLPVIEALAYVHQHGIVHRDLKPDNIFLSQQCGRIQPKLLDFGIAKLHDMPAEHRRTGRGAVVGSPGYMAPEHARGIDVDHRADIFTASLVLYETITGKQAFRGTNYNSLLREVIERHLEPIVKLGLGDAALSRILERGLKKDPAKRFASCEELGRALATWLLSQGESDDVTGEPLNSWWRDANSRLPELEATTSAALKRRLSSGSGRPAMGTHHGVSLSAGFSSHRPRRGRIALAALLLTGLVGGFIVTQSFTFSTTSHAAAPSTPPVVAAAALPRQPVVTPVMDAPVPAARPTSDKAIDSRGNVPIQHTPKAPMVVRNTRGKSAAPSVSTNSYANPYAVEPAPQPAEPPHTTLSLADLERQTRDAVVREAPPPAPQPDAAPLKIPPRGSDETELKDPYP